MGADTERQRSLILQMCKDTRKPAEHRQISNIRRTLVGNTLVDNSLGAPYIRAFTVIQLWFQRWSISRMWGYTNQFG